MSKNVPAGKSSVLRGIKAFSRGEPVLIHDGDDREDETDIVYPACSVTHSDVARLRNDAGGLICVALGDHVARAFDLPFLAQEINHPSAEDVELSYGDRSSFSLPVNHANTYTGITDRDRSLTITRLGQAAREPNAVKFTDQFHCPGHVHLLRGAEDLDTRQGHTELSLALADASGQPPATVVCEMLDDETGGALPTAEVREYASEESLPMIEGQDLIEHILGAI